MESRQIRILTDGVGLDGQLETPERPHGIVLFRATPATRPAPSAGAPR
jgi:hypothetical protein